VAALAVGNGGGRIGAGILSDRIGRRWTLLLAFVLQAVLIYLLSQATEGTVLAQPVILAILSALIGANYGSNLSLFPSITKDFYGLTNFGVNYGLVFTAWGVGGFMLAMAAGRIYDVYKTFSYSYYGAAALLVLAALLTLALKTPHHHEAPAAAA
jgi:OFA family oxalate/formate antiporter-like MFS transporter